ncbi:MAG: NAD-glutamate dehydrogenase [Gemmatimonadota bacterium]|nr:NAD-glutamate dehydrogenase [Gemmatimonadota bacterium]
MDRSATGNGPVAEVLEAVRPLAEDPQVATLQDFARLLLSRASEDWLQTETPERMAAAARSLYRLVEETGSGEVGVRIEAVEKSEHRTLLLTVMPDCPFIVETLREGLHAADVPILALLHPILVLDRDPDGRIREIRDRGGEGERVSAILVVLDAELDADDAAEIERETRYRLGQVWKATEDFEPMMEALTGLEDDLRDDVGRFPWRSEEIEEIRELLGWLREGNMILLGYRAYDVFERDDGKWIRVREDSGLGILRDDRKSGFHEPRRFDSLPAELQARLVGGPMLIVSKTNALSPVHRRSRMDDISVKELGPEGEITGERRFLGLFTSKALSQDASRIPILRRKLGEILDAEQVDRGSHDYGLIVRTFNSLPKAELFLTPVPDLVKMIDTVIATHGTEESLVYARSDALGRGVNVMVILPRRKFSGEVREAIQEALVATYRGRLLNYYLTMGESEQARLHFYIASDIEDIESVDLGAVREAVRHSIRTWPEHLAAALEERHDRGRTAELTDRYGQAFSSQYQAATRIPGALDDIETLETMRRTGNRQVVLADTAPPSPCTYRLKVFDRHTRYVLSDVVPILENFGFRVLTADAYEVRPREEQTSSTIHTFTVEVAEDWKIDRSAAENRVSDAFFAIQSGWAENIALNRLILSAGLTWRQVALIKSYGAYAFRIGAVSSRLGLRRPLIENPKAADLLFRIFATLFDPGLEGERETAILALEDAYLRTLDGVRSIEDDRTLRRLLALVRSTVRTNYFQTRLADRPDAPIALKFDCGTIDFMPRPRPHFEVWVNSARTEGAHLRMGEVARGGLRWSDRQEDFRLEVLGLVKTQQVKNAVIVPAGAKGAFVVSRPPADPSTWRQAGVTSYRDFVGALLSLTDNVVDGQVVHPPETVIRDGDDPYLVVAADKGTATLSDTANELAAEHGFWLGDAFASGGSHGYDHKEMGITARGAWEAVTLHFAEMGTDIATDEFLVAGIGDMSGDVFGNGMLLSRAIRLVAAFDHRHIFLDPDPDAAASFAERRRLFELPGSSWADYDPARISEGGGVWERGDKRIELSEPARRRLGIEDEVVNGDTLIRAILRAPVDLLWNGGIGTYVKASAESHADVGDPSNDTVRVDARELRCRVIGEGGNLGLTQNARVEFALAGGRCNTDALDNSAGVDTSDHEVNSKILLGAVIASGQLDAERRDDVLAAATDDVAERVLRNTRQQSLAVSLDERRVRARPGTFRDALAGLERIGLLDRGLEFLPGAEEMEERIEDGRPALVRPELSVLLAYAKLQLKGALLRSELLDDPGFRGLLHGYFPAAIREAAGDAAVVEHRLARHIVATRLTNLMVDQLGGTGLSQLLHDTHHGPEEVAKAWYLAWCVSGADGRSREIRELGEHMAQGVQMGWLLRIGEALDRATRWLLANVDLQRPLDELVDWFRQPVQSLARALPDLLSEPKRIDLEGRIALYATDGMNAELAAGMVALEYLDGLLPIAQLAREVGVEAAQVGRLYFGLAGRIDFPWLQDRLAELPGADRWQVRAARSLAIELEAARRRIVRHLIAGGPAERPPETALAEFGTSCGDNLGRISEILAELQAEDEPGLPGLMVAVHAIQEGCDAWIQGA